MMNKIKKIIEWFKKLNHIIKTYDSDLMETRDDISNCRSNIREGVQLIKDRTNIHADIHLRKNHPSEIIVIGRYRNADYIQTFSIANDEIEGLIRQLKDMEKYGVVTRVDAAPHLKAIIEQELKYW